MRLPSFGYVILVVSISGVLINVASLAFLVWRHREAKLGASRPRRRQRVQSTVFHHLLIVLAACDLVVVCCCALAYGLPDVWGQYLAAAHPYLVPYILPITHMAVMSSVYSTILISFERYVRICYICQLRPSSMITVDNFKYYVLAILIGPIVFYTPKFFEVKPTVMTTNYFSQVNCSRLNVLSEINSTIAHFVITGMSLEERVYLEALLDTCGEDVTSKLEAMNEGKMDMPNLKKENGSQTPVVKPVFKNSLRNMTRQEHNLMVKPTKLRSSPIYYRLYYVHLNTIFASVIPLVSLLFLNISTVKALKKMLREASEAENAGEIVSPRSLIRRQLLQLKKNGQPPPRHHTSLRSPQKAAQSFRRAIQRSLSIGNISPTSLNEASTEMKDRLCPHLGRRCSSAQNLATRTPSGGDISMDRESFYAPELSRISLTHLETREVEEEDDEEERNLANGSQEPEQQVLLDQNSIIPFAVVEEHSVAVNKHVVDIFITECSSHPQSPMQPGSPTQKLLVASSSEDIKKTSTNKLDPMTAAAETGLDLLVARNKSSPLYKRNFFQEQQRQLSFTEPLEHVYSVAIPKDVSKSTKQKDNSASRRSTLVTVLDSASNSRRESRNCSTDWGKSSSKFINNTSNRPRSASMCHHPSIDEDEDPEEDEKEVSREENMTSGIGKMLNLMMIGRSSQSVRDDEGNKSPFDLLRRSQSLFDSGFRLNRPTMISGSIAMTALRNNSNTSDLEFGMQSASSSYPNTRRQSCLVGTNGENRVLQSNRCHRRRGLTSEQTQEQRLTRISILIVWLFLFCHVWKLVPTAFEAGFSHDGLTHSNWPQWVLVAENMSHLLITINSSINFLIYAIM